VDLSPLRCIPNGISALRLILVLPIAFLIIKENHIGAFLLLAISGLSDGLDGFMQAIWVGFNIWKVD
jgi:cardiolipin synthase (CMP-forming)